MAMLNDGIHFALLQLLSGAEYLTTFTAEQRQALALFLPEDPTLAATRFYTLSMGIKTPVEFWVDEQGDTRLMIERDCYRKVG